jgi:hypothetical protein
LFKGKKFEFLFLNFWVNVIKIVMKKNREEDEENEEKVRC